MRHFATERGLEVDWVFGLGGGAMVAGDDSSRLSNIAERRSPDILKMASPIVKSYATSASTPRTLGAGWKRHFATT